MAKRSTRAKHLPDHFIDRLIKHNELGQPFKL